MSYTQEQIERVRDALESQDFGISTVGIGANQDGSVLGLVFTYEPSEEVMGQIVAIGKNVLGDGFSTGHINVSVSPARIEAQETQAPITAYAGKLINTTTTIDPTSKGRG